MSVWDTWLTRRVRWRLLVFTAASFVLPWAVGEFAKTFYQAGLHGDPVRSQLLIDYIVIGAIVFSLTMVVTYALGAWIHGVMRGPRHDGDRFPEASGEALRDD